MKIEMKKTVNKKVIWVSAIVALGAVSTVAGIWLYRQLKKMEDYGLDFKNIIVRKVSTTEFIFDLYMIFTNKSNLGVTLSKQEYDVYANNVYITTVKNDTPNDIKAKSESEIGMRVNVNPIELVSKIGLNPIELITSPKKINIKLVMKYKVKVLFFDVSIPEIIYEDTLYNMMNY
jgi:LEA14-like dessication related protein